MGKTAIYTAILCFALLTLSGKAMAFSPTALGTHKETANTQLIHQVAKKTKKPVRAEQKVTPPKRVFRKDRLKLKYKRFKRSR